MVRWSPALLWMAAIFVVSSTPSLELPAFGSLDYVVKKAGHSVAYALLALLYWRALGKMKERLAPAWALAVLYALTDEFHQKFVPGRNPSLLDVFLFDGGGAAVALLFICSSFRNRSRRPAQASNRR